MKPPQINLHHLITFYFVAFEKNFTAAAEMLCLTQPAVTLHIKSLENQFGVKLFSIKRQKVYLTEEGDRLFDYAKKIFDQVTAAEEYLRRQIQNVLHLGVACSITFHLTPVVNQFKELYPTVKVTLREASSLQLVEELIDFKHDLCVVGTLGHIPNGLKVFHTQDSDEMVFVASPRHAVCSKGEIGWEELVKYPLIIQGEGSAAREALLRNLQNRHLSPIIDTVVDNIESAKKLARENKGLAFMFLPNVVEEISLGELKIVPLAGDGIKVGTDIIVRDNATTLPVINRFLKTIQEYFIFLVP
jgi:DNA-binding transcriptional LysR family regulator